ncbi:glycosyl transferase [Peribacillus simplex]|nr:glycosyl transferase [Peribacillus simplex]
MKSKVKYIKNPLRLILPLADRRLFNWVPDKTFLKLVYLGQTGKKLNIDNPQTFNEKLQWIKLYDRKTRYNTYADKYAVRKYVEETIGAKYLIPLYYVYDSVEDIDWEKLPDKFVLKCTHGSGSNIICEDKNSLDIEECKIKLNYWMKKNWYWFGREWSYKDIKPRIICEKYMVDESETELKDYKIFCFNGEPKLIQVDFNRHIEHKRNLFTTNWQYIDAKIKYPTQSSFNISKPNRLDDMLKCARALSSNIPHLRVDFYSINDQVYFGEMTFYHGSGFEKFEPESLALKMGSWIELPNQEG